MCSSRVGRDHVRLKGDLFGRCTPSFRGEPRFDRISVENEGLRTRALKGEPYYGELRCLCALVWPGKPIQNVAVVRWFEDVCDIKDWVYEENEENVPAETVALRARLGPLFDQLDNTIPGNASITDGRYRLGRRYVCWQVRLETTTPYSVININKLYKPEHLIRDRKLLGENLLGEPAWYVQNAITYYSNLPQKMIQKI